MPPGRGMRESPPGRGVPPSERRCPLARPTPMPCEAVNGLFPGRGVPGRRGAPPEVGACPPGRGPGRAPGRGAASPEVFAPGLEALGRDAFVRAAGPPGLGAPGRGAPGLGAAGFGAGRAGSFDAAGFGVGAPGVATGFASDGFGGSDFADGLPAGFGEGLAGVGLLAGFSAAGFGVGDSAFGEKASRTLRTTGASRVEDALLTYSPISVSLLRSSLLVIPISFAISWTRGLATTLLREGHGGTRARWPTSWLAGSSHVLIEWS